MPPPSSSSEVRAQDHDPGRWTYSEGTTTFPDHSRHEASMHLRTLHPSSPLSSLQSSASDPAEPLAFEVKCRPLLPRRFDGDYPAYVLFRGTYSPRTEKSLFYCRTRGHPTSPPGRAFHTSERWVPSSPDPPEYQKDLLEKRSGPRETCPKDLVRVYVRRREKGPYVSG